MDIVLVLNVALGVAFAVVAWWVCRLVVGVLLILLGCIGGSPGRYRERVAAAFRGVGSRIGRS